MLRLRSRPLRVALVGNPNVGKSVVFSRLTGRYATVSNYPGTTVAVTKGRALVGAEVCDVIDTPGVNALEGPLSEDERITRDVVAGDAADIVIQIVDARNIRRALMLTAQLAGLGKPILVALNMVDEALARGIAVDADELARELGVPVVEMVAVEGRGLQTLRDAWPTRGPSASRPWPMSPPRRRGRTRSPLACATSTTLSLATMQEALSRATRRPLTGLPILALVLYTMYLFVGVFGAQTLVGFVEEVVFGRLVNPAAISLVVARSGAARARLLRRRLRPDHDGADLRHRHRAAGRHDVLPAVRLARRQRLHPAAGDFQRPHLPRDGPERQGGAADGAGPRLRHDGDDDDADPGDAEGAPDRHPAAGARRAVLGPARDDHGHPRRHLVRRAPDAGSAWSSPQMFLVGWLAARLLPGERSEFILELPPIRLPRLTNVLTKTRLRVWWYLGEAVPLFLAGTVLLFALDKLHVLGAIGRAGAADRSRAARAAGRDGGNIRHGIPAARLRRRRPVQAGANRVS